MILIVDDKRENIISLKGVLELNHFEVDTALSGEEALRKILKTSYALIILDVQMPGMDGFEVAEAISGFSKAKDIPIIFLSAVNTDKKFITKGYTSGGIDYVTKPVDADILLLKVKTFYKLYEQKRELSDMQLVLQKEIEVRKKAQQQLSEANESLEQRVSERTSELKELNLELEERNDELKKFAWVASHDLKEPLRKIQVFSFLLRDQLKLDEPEQIKYMGRIIDSSERMSRLINDVLNYSSLSAPVLFQSTDLNEVVADILTDLEIIIKEKSAVVHIAELPKIDAIPSQMRQIFQNLVSNALKFSRKDTAPEIIIRAEMIAKKNIEAAAGEGSHYRITVQDNGIGFSEDYLDKIFTIFQRLHTRDEYAGNGIGLAITKRIIDKHNGMITARSRENEGTTFVLVLPARQEQVQTLSEN